MSLADDLSPEACLEACAEQIGKNIVKTMKNLPEHSDDADTKARKYTILGKCFREIRSYTKEALKSLQIGSDEAATVLMIAEQHATLESFGDAKLSITGPDGETVETTAGRFNQVAEAVQRDPSIVDKILGA